MIVTNKPIDYRSAPYGQIAIIPRGTPVIPADNLSGIPGKYWAEPWEGMTEEEQSWQRNYGFLIDSLDVTGVVPEPPDSYSHRGWPGDGSGEDDLADMNANEADDYRDE